MSKRLILLGCVASKRDIGPEDLIKARDLYDSPLWRARRSYAEATAVEWNPYAEVRAIESSFVLLGDHSPPVSWAILSARFGVIPPHRRIFAYDRRITQRDDHWCWRVRRSLAQLPDFAAIEVHAGEPYVEALREALRGIGDLTIETPLKGLRIGEQLAWYAARAKDNNDNKQEEEE